MKAKRRMRLSLLCGILGCLCFGVGDWLLGYVDPAPVSETIFYFIRAGHGAEYDAWKIVVTLVMAMIGMCFMIPGMASIANIAKKAASQRLLRYLFALCAVGWIVIHFAVAVNVWVFSLAEKAGGRELAVLLSQGLDSVCLLFLYCAYVFVAAALLADCPDPLRENPLGADGGAVYARHSHGKHCCCREAAPRVAFRLWPVHLLHERRADRLVRIFAASSRSNDGGLRE